MTQKSVLLEAWRFTCTERARSIVLPDGCQDLILLQRGAQSVCFVSELTASAYAVESEPGSAFLGFRLQPGAECNTQALLHAVNQNRGLSDQLICDAIAEYVRLDEGVMQALASIAAKQTIVAAARTAGVSERTLERLLLRKTGRSPSYWKALARVRRAGRDVAHVVRARTDLLGSKHSATEMRTALFGSFAELAAAHGFSDQSHMTHEFRRWFQVTPAQLRANPSLLRAVGESGYC